MRPSFPPPAYPGLSGGYPAPASASSATGSTGPASSARSNSANMPARASGLSVKARELSAKFTEMHTDISAIILDEPELAGLTEVNRRLLAIYTAYTMLGSEDKRLFDRELAPRSREFSIVVEWAAEIERNPAQGPLPIAPWLSQAAPAPFNQSPVFYVPQVTPFQIQSPPQAALWSSSGHVNTAESTSCCASTLKHARPYLITAASVVGVIGVGVGGYVLAKHLTTV